MARFLFEQTPEPYKVIGVGSCIMLNNTEPVDLKDIRPFIADYVENVSLEGSIDGMILNHKTGEVTYGEHKVYFLGFVFGSAN